MFYNFDFFCNTKMNNIDEKQIRLTNYTQRKNIKQITMVDFYNGVYILCKYLNNLIDSFIHRGFATLNLLDYCTLRTQKGN